MTKYRVLEKRMGINYAPSFHLEKSMIFFWIDVYWSCSLEDVMNKIQSLEVESNNTELFNYEKVLFVKDIK